MGWFEAFVVINVILIALLLAVLMYLHRIYGVLKSIDERDGSKMQSKTQPPPHQLPHPLPGWCAVCNPTVLS